MIIMTYEFFKTMVMTQLKEYIPEQYKDFKVKDITFKRINEIKDAITLVNPNSVTSNTSVVVYLDELYDLYMQTYDFKMVLEHAAKLLTKNTQEIQIPKLDKATENIVFQLVNTLRNEELLKNVPSHKYNDLSVIYRWVMDMDENGAIQSAIVTNELAETIGADENKLFELAMENTVRLFPPVISPIADVVRQFISKAGIENLMIESELKQIMSQKYNIPDDMNLWVVSNENNYYAAGLMLYDGLLNSIADKLGSDLYILPSSVNEILIAKAALFSPKELVSMVRYTNAGEFVNKNEFLSNHVYCYSRKLKKVYIAA